MTCFGYKARMLLPCPAAIAAYLLAIMAIPGAVLAAEPRDEVEQVVDREIRSALPEDGISGVAAVVRRGERTSFFNYGHADLAQRRPIDPDALFNLASIGKVFDATLLALAIKQGQVSLDDRVVECMPELRQGGDIRRVTIGQLATHTSGLLLPQDHPPWPEQGYTLPEFLGTLNAWTAESDHQPGRQHIYTHAGFMLLHLALERRLGGTLAALIADRVLRPLGLVSTAVPMGADDPRGSLDPELRSRAVQGYGEDGAPIGVPGDVQGYYLWPGSAQMFSSTRDMAVFLAANLGELPRPNAVQDAMALAQQGAIAIAPRVMQGLAWEVLRERGETMVEKKGGLNNNSSYIGFIKRAKLGIVVLWNRGNQPAVETGRRILLELAQGGSAE
jgi:beta-lactamase class C